MGKASRERQLRRERAAVVPAATAGPDTRPVLASWMDAAHAALLRGDRRRFITLVDDLCGEGVAPLSQQKRLVERLLRDRLLSAVQGAWSRGWQPADAVRYARRELSAAHVRLVGAAVAADLEHYAPDTVDPRWAAQLRDAGVAASWQTGESFLTASERGWPGGWPALVEAALEVLLLLSRVSPLEQLGPLPGRGRVEPSAPGRTDVNERLLARVRALLAKAESTTFPAEAETFTAGAQALMARHSIDAALLAAAEDPSRRSGVTSTRVGVDNPYEGPKVSLLNAVASANRCRSVWFPHYGFASVVGFTSDLESVELLFTSLLVQATAGLTSKGAAVGAGSRSRSRAFRQSYLLAFAQRIGERLTETMGEATTEAAAAAGGVNLLPVLASRVEEVDDTLSQMYPDLVHRSVSRASDAAGWASGRSAADLASLNARTPLPAKAG